MTKSLVAQGMADVLKLSQFGKYLKPRPRDFHKGQCGHVLVVGGESGYSGAVRMAGEAALRVGAGLVSIATRIEHASLLSLTRPELMCHGVMGATELMPLLKKADVVIVGPGMGRSPWAQKLLYLVLKSDKPAIVVDADGLNLLVDKPQQKMNWILTPHPGEAARLLNKNVDEIQRDRFSAIRQLQQQFGGVCVLKGAGTLIKGPDDAIPSICKSGNPGMATAGMGDVLSGVIGGLLAQGIPLTDAAKLGVLVHAMAADLAVEERGERGLIATDLMGYLRQMVNH